MYTAVLNSIAAPAPRSVPELAVPPTLDAEYEYVLVDEDDDVTLLWVINTVALATVAGLELAAPPTLDTDTAFSPLRAAAVA